MGRPRPRPTTRGLRAEKTKRGPAAKPKKRPVAKPKKRPVAKPKKRTVAKPKKRPVAKPKRRPVAKPKKRPVAKPKKRLVAKPKKRPVAKPKKRTVAKPKKRPVAKPKKRPVAKPKKRPVTKQTRPTLAIPSPGPVAKPKLRPEAKPKARREENPKQWPAVRTKLRRPKVAVFIAASVDGFIARDDGELDWLEVRGDTKGEDYGYKAFVGEIDGVVMGRKTYEKALKLGAWPYGKTPVVVLSTRPLLVPKAIRGSVETMADRPAQIVGRLARAGLHRLYLDGGLTIQGFLRAGVVDEITITRVPVLLGGGVPLFGALPADVRLRHVETRSFKSGLVQTTYTVRRERRKPEKSGDAKAEVDLLIRSRGSEDPPITPPTLPLPEDPVPDVPDDAAKTPAVTADMEAPTSGPEPAVDPPVADPDPFFNAPSPDLVDDSPVADPGPAVARTDEDPVADGKAEHAKRPAVASDVESPTVDTDPAVGRVDDEDE